MDKVMLIALICLVSGLVLLYQAWRLRRGYDKWEFLRQINPIIAKDGQYGKLPLGIGLLIAALGACIAHIEGSELGTGLGRVLFLVGFLGGGILYLIFTAWKPSWLKPKWILWLETNYEQQTIEFMFDQARRDGQWRKRTETDEGLKAWAEEMAREYEFTRQQRMRS
jgi:hypothetical protein